MKLTKSVQNTVFRLQIELTKEVVDETDEVSNHTGKASLTRFEEIFEEYKGVSK
ncbi:chlorohydrolase [Streptococcus pneumoniae]|uniref:chlorohydrolase n=1 Tax=Streptococcus pneumoniae TaxID=1313 RepID=UPI000B595D9C|nr:chlorohydrolase [Streptococcus pneumoniae]SNK73025.1 chlorohydrolase [Streptococcus pneumoniae]